MSELSRDLNKAKEILLSGEYTCVLYSDVEFLTSEQRGVKPLVALVESGESFSGFCSADKVIGKATAFLYVLLKVRAVYARVISKSALEVLKSYNVEVQYDNLVENIINRQGDGTCPFEKAVLDISEPSIAYTIIRDKMREMNISL